MEKGVPDGRKRNKDGTLRKRRNDRNHVIYKITCVVTGDTYIGLTVARGRAYRQSAMIRWEGHLRHAFNECRPYLLHECIRAHGPGAFNIEVLCVVRGKAAAHAKEKELVKELVPTLNVELTYRKAARRVTR